LQIEADSAFDVVVLWCDYGLIRSLGIHLPANMKKVRGSCVKLFPLSKMVMSIHRADWVG
jgi:hypothetical protein